MQDITGYLETFTQHHKLSIRLSSNTYGHLPEEMREVLLKPHRKTHYFFLFIQKGNSRHSVDLHPINVNDGEILFILPHQIHQLPKSKADNTFFKVSFDEECLSLLPRQFPFLINPLHDQKVKLSVEGANRVASVFDMLSQLLQTKAAETDLVLTYLNTLLTEINSSYFSQAKTGNATNDKLARYIQFKSFVEKELVNQPSVNTIAAALSLNTNNLYSIVKQYSGHSPKEFITARLILEAQRRLYYTESSIKELAFDLGFNDPDYFSRLFKKTTGKSITQFLEGFQDLSG